MSHLEISLLGPLQVRLAGAVIKDFKTAKVQALLAYLAVELHHPQPREALVGLLWPERPEPAARLNLRQTLYRLRQVIPPAYLLTTRKTIRFNADSDYSLDAATFVGLIAACHSHAHANLTTCQTCLARLQQAIALYRGDFLANFYLADSPAFEEWALLKRAWFRREALLALRRLTTAYEQQGDYDIAQRYARQQVDLDYLREEAHQQLMRVLARSGRRSQALAQYAACRRILAAELGVEPAQETTALYQRIRAAEAVRRHAYRPPPQRSAFVGREEELAELIRCLANPRCRLLTILGPGGIGKTRLALKALSNQKVANAFLHGVYFVSLVGISSANFLVPTIADATGFSFFGANEPKVQLLNYLREKDLLLVLDNFEHLLTPVAGEKQGTTGLLVDILAEAPEVKLLVTSRQRLNLRWERLLAIEGLPFPPVSGNAKTSFDHHLNDGETTKPLESYSAVQLFVQAARRVAWRFALSDEVKLDVRRICQLVAGLPLGIELAAASLPVHSCRDIARQIERNLEFLSTSFQDVPERHRSMRAVFNHSWELLSGVEQVVFRKLSVFRSGFRSEAAHQVAGANEGVLTALVNKSLLQRSASGRYHLHELLRQFAAEKLDELPAKKETVQDQFCSYYATFLQERGDAVKIRQDKDVLLEIDTEIDNIRLSLEWMLRLEKPLALTDIEKYGETLWYVYDMRGWYQEGAAAFRRAAEGLTEEIEALEAAQRAGVEAGEQTTMVDRATAVKIALGNVLAWQGGMYWRLGHYQQARELLQKNLAELRVLTSVSHAKHKAPNQMAIALCLIFLGVLVYHQGEYSESIRLLREGLNICEENNDRWGIALCCCNMSLSLQAEGRYEEAAQLIQKGLAMWREMDGKRGLGIYLGQLATVNQALGKFAEARQLAEESVAICREIGDKFGLNIALRNLAAIARSRGEHTEAKQLLQENLSLWQEIGDPWGLADTLNHLGHTYCTLGDDRAAERCFRQALETAIKIQSPPVILLAIVGFIELMENRNDLDIGQEQALEILAFVRYHPASDQETKDRAVDLFRGLQAEASSQVVAAAQARGKTRNLADVAAEVLALKPG